MDGRGTTRVIKAILRRVITVRKAVESDCEQIYKWANDDDTRAASFNSGPIEWDTHRNWLSQRLQDSNCLLLICSDDKGKSLGLVRFDLAGDEAIISINLDPNMRGQGLAGFIIIRTIDELFKRCNISKVSAFIKPQNHRSAKAFERAGFSEIGPTTIKGIKARHYMINNEDLIRQSPSNKLQAMIMSFMNIAGRKIGKRQPVYIIAEISANHNQSYDEAVKLIHAAKESRRGCRQAADLHTRHHNHRLQERAFPHWQGDPLGGQVPLRPIR